jgi:hypothetical protein
MELGICFHQIACLQSNHKAPWQPHSLAAFALSINVDVACVGA